MNICTLCSCSCLQWLLQVGFRVLHNSGSCQKDILSRYRFIYTCCIPLPPPPHCQMEWFIQGLFPSPHLSFLSLSPLLSFYQLPVDTAVTPTSFSVCGIWNVLSLWNVWRCCGKYDLLFCHWISVCACLWMQTCVRPYLERELLYMTNWNGLTTEADKKHNVNT